MSKDYACQLSNVEAIVFLLMVLVPFYVFAIAAASMSDDGSLIRVPLWGCVGCFVGYWNSGWAMDAVAGKLPKDEQLPPYKNIAN